jgi:hypothetical protein
MSKKIAIFSGDFFWSSTPYESLEVFQGLNEHFDCDLLMFNNDIRLNKKFSGKEKFYFDRSLYRGVKNLKTINGWKDFSKISSDYDLILSSTHIAPKTRWPYGQKNLKRFRSNINSKMVAWDIGGCDILTTATHYADFFFTKGSLWTEWLTKMGKKAFTTGSPQFDYFMEGVKKKKGICDSESDFIEKYSLDSDKRRILVLPSNPGANKHNKQLKQNMDCLKYLYSLKDVEILIKTYPNDYIYWEKGGHSTGVYKRIFPGYNGPQYDYLKDKFPSAIIVESQDHHASMKYCDKIFNIAGSHAAWETLLTDSKSFTMNYSNKTYFKHLSYLPDYAVMPDDKVNCELSDPKEALGDFKVRKEECEGFVLGEHSTPNMVKAIKEILGGNID